MSHPGNPPEGFACLPPSALTTPDPRDGYERFSEAFRHAVLAEERDDIGESNCIIPCYVCGRTSAMVCMQCCRNLCTGCRVAGHHRDGGRCDFVIEGRSPD